MDLVTCYDWNQIEINPKPLEHRQRSLHPPAGCDSPRDPNGGQIPKELTSARERLNVTRPPLVGRGTKFLKAFDPLGVDVEPGFPQEPICEQASAHADLAVDSPCREREDMLGDLLRSSLGNVAVPAQILPCINVDLNRGVAYRQFKNIFPRRGNEVSRAIVSFEHPDRRE